MTILLVGVQLGPCARYREELLKRGDYAVIIHTSLLPLPRHVINDVDVCVAIVQEDDVAAQEKLQSWMKQHVFSRGIVIDWTTYK